MVCGQAPVGGRSSLCRASVEGDGCAGAHRRDKPGLEELSHKRVISLPAASRSRRTGEERQPLGGGRETSHLGRVKGCHDLCHLRCDALRDRGPHQELLEVLRQVTDGLLSQVVVELLICAGHAPYEATNLERG